MATMNSLGLVAKGFFFGTKIYINSESFNYWLTINLGLRMVLFSQNNVSKQHFPYVIHKCIW